MTILKTNLPKQVLAFTREKDKDQVLAIFNLSALPVDVLIQVVSAGDYKEYFSGDTKTLEKGSTLHLDKWGVQIFIRK